MDKDELFSLAEDVLSDSSLSTEDKVMWEQKLLGASAERLNMFISTVVENEEVLILATKSLKKQLEAEGDDEAMKKVLDDELEEVKSLLEEK